MRTIPIQKVSSVSSEWLKEAENNVGKIYLIASPYALPYAEPLDNWEVYYILACKCPNYGLMARVWMVDGLNKHLPACESFK